MIITHQRIGHLRLTHRHIFTNLLSLSLHPPVEGKMTTSQEWPVFSMHLSHLTFLCENQQILHDSEFAVSNILQTYLLRLRTVSLFLTPSFTKEMIELRNISNGQITSNFIDSIWRIFRLLFVIFIKGFLNTSHSLKEQETCVGDLHFSRVVLAIQLCNEIRPLHLVTIFSCNKRYLIPWQLSLWKRFL